MLISSCNTTVSCCTQCASSRTQLTLNLIELCLGWKCCDDIDIARSILNTLPRRLASDGTTNTCMHVLKREIGNEAVYSMKWKVRVKVVESEGRLSNRKLHRFVRCTDKDCLGGVVITTAHTSHQCLVEPQLPATVWYRILMQQLL